MYLMYVDESGDPGRSKHSSEHFILSGLIISENDWNTYLSNLKWFRGVLKTTYNLSPRVELHAAELIRINNIEEYKQIRKTQRIEIIKLFLKVMPRLFPEGRIINICFKKNEHPSLEEFQTRAWTRLIQRYDTFLKKTVQSRGIIICDESDEPLIRGLLRQMRVYNPVTSKYGTPTLQVPTNNIIEDVFIRRSQHSYFIQAVDFIAHGLYRKEFPKGSLKKFGLEKAFDQLEPILFKQASGYDKMGIVRK